MADENGKSVEEISVPADLFGRIIPALVSFEPGDDQHLAKIAWELDDMLDSKDESVAKLEPASRLLLRGIEALRGGAADEETDLLGALIDLAKVLYRAAVDPQHRRTGFKKATGRVEACLDAESETAPNKPEAEVAAPDPETPTTEPQPATPAAEPAATEPTEAPADDDSSGSFILLPDEPDVELLAEFITENNELIEMAEGALLALEENPDDDEAINTVFRAFHTIKGTSAFLGLEPMSVLAHRAETLLSRVRDKEIAYGRSEANLSLRSIDVLKDLMAGLESALAGGDAERPRDYLPLMDELVVAGSAEAVPTATQPATPVDTTAAVEPPQPAAASEPPNAAAAADPDDTQQPDAETAPEAMPSPQPATVSADPPAAPKRMASPTTVEPTVRVQTGRLDHLVDMVGELVIAQSILAQDAAVLQGADHGLIQKVTHLSKIVRDLQALSMSLRMIPIKATFKRMNRLVRDLTQKFDKQVQLIVEGEDTEIDRNMVDVLADPLVHMIRNALDHGIETPEERRRAGKPPLGTVRLKACHASGYIVVSMEDDGRGIDREVIVRKAIEKGLIESDRGMSDSDVFSLIFEPGFSTAAAVTAVSGRGVGMDVVRKSVEQLHGRIVIDSKLGQGTTVSILLPITLAISDGMLVRVGEQRYIIPTSNILRSLRPTRTEIKRVAGEGEMVVMREGLLPMYRLSELFEIPDAENDPTRALLVIISDQEDHYGLLVDELLGQQQIVVKSLGAGLGRTPGISGGAILGDGMVGLILDVRGLAAQARSLTQCQEDVEVAS